MTMAWFISARPAFLARLGTLVALGSCVLFGCKKQPPESDLHSMQVREQNAAEEYRSLYDAMGGNLIALLDEGSGVLTPKLERALPDAQPIIARLVWATGLEYCDWEIDYSRGIVTELPNLRKLRELTRLLRADTQRAIRDGDMDAAAEEITAIVRMSRHVRGKGTLEAMVAFAIAHVAMDLAIEHDSSWNPSQRDLMLGEFRQIDEHNPFGATAKFAWESRLAAREGVREPDEHMFRNAQQETTDKLARVVRMLQQS